MVQPSGLSGFCSSFRRQIGGELLHVGRGALRLCRLRQHRSRSADHGIQGDREQRQQDGDRDAAATAAASAVTTSVGGGIVEQLALQLLPRFGQIGRRQGAVAVVALELGKAIAMDGGIQRGQGVGADGVTATGATRGATAAPGRRRPASPLQDKK
jgi:hypothetical protein